MIVLSVIWVALFLLFYLIGINFLKLSAIDDLLHSIEEKLILSVWLGLIVFASTLLALSIFTRLTPVVFLVIAGFSIIWAMMSRSLRREISADKSHISLKKIAQWIAILIPISAVFTQQVFWFDTGLYHVQLIKWLSQFGSTHGMALAHSRREHLKVAKALTIIGSIEIGASHL